jgi:hypothetical protein
MSRGTWNWSCNFISHALACATVYWKEIFISHEICGVLMSDKVENMVVYGSRLGFDKAIRDKELHAKAAVEKLLQPP